jgi:hypothetical protein
MADSSVPITAGAGTSIKTFLDAATVHVQYVRPHTGAAATVDSWTTSTTAATSRVAADETRTGLIFTNTSTATCYLRPDATAPTAAICMVIVPPGGMYEAVPEWRELAWSVVAAASSVGVLNIWKATAA